MDTLRIDASNRSEFAGKRILVTGGTKGAGKAIADRFLQGGGTVIITARSAPEEQTRKPFYPSRCVDLRRDDEGHP